MHVIKVKGEIAEERRCGKHSCILLVKVDGK